MSISPDEYVQNFYHVPRPAYQMTNLDEIPSSSRTFFYPANTFENPYSRNYESSPHGMASSSYEKDNNDQESLSQVNLYRPVTDECLCPDCVQNQMNVSVETFPDFISTNLPYTCAFDGGYNAPQFFQPLAASTPVEGHAGFVSTQVASNSSCFDEVSQCTAESSLAPWSDGSYSESLLIIDCDEPKSVIDPGKELLLFDDGENPTVLESYSVSVQQPSSSNHLNKRKQRLSHRFILPKPRTPIPDKRREKQKKIVLPKPNCLVCGRLSSGNHYEAIACEGCKAFFRRIVTRNRHNSYECKGSEACIIDLSDRRTCCKSCRFKKCLEAGMKPEACFKRDSNSSTNL